jgi:hypothetical protein
MTTDKRQDEAERYRQAGNTALEQLDWAIRYLHGMRKTEIARALARNSSVIRKRLVGAPEEPAADSGDQ